MAKLKMTAAVTSQVQLAEGIYDLRLAAGEIAAQAVPGQFVSLYSKDGSRLLPRPISLCGIDKEKENCVWYTVWQEPEQRNFPH